MPSGGFPGQGGAQAGPGATGTYGTQGQAAPYPSPAGPYPNQPGAYQGQAGPYPTPSGPYPGQGGGGTGPHQPGAGDPSTTRAGGAAYAAQPGAEGRPPMAPAPYPHQGAAQRTGAYPYQPGHPGVTAHGHPGMTTQGYAGAYGGYSGGYPGHPGAVPPRPAYGAGAPGHPYPAPSGYPAHQGYQPYPGQQVPPGYAGHPGYPGAPPGAHVRFLPPSGPGGGPPPPTHPAARPPAPQKPEPDVTSGAHRLHWATIPFQSLLVTVVFLAIPGPILLQFGAGWALLLALGAALGTTVYALASWRQSSFGLRGDHLVVHSGLFRRVSREIPLSRLQAVDVVRPLLMQVVGLAELRVELAGGDSSEIRLRYLARGTAERLRAALLAHAAGLSGKTPEAPEWPLYRLPFGLLLGALAFRVPVLAAFLLFLALLSAGFAAAEPGVLGGAVPLLLGLVRGFLGPLLRYTDFYSSLSPDGLRLRYGIFQARMQTVPPGRVQAVRIVEPLLWRPLGVVRVEANVAGYVGERQMDSSTLLPVAPRSLAYSLVNELFPEARSDASQVPLAPAERGGPRREALGMDDQLVVTRRGLFCHTTEIVPHVRVQSVRMSAGPFLLRRGMATVEVDTPPGPIRARATGWHPGRARRILDSIVAHGHTARSSTAGPERWATRSEMQADPAGPDTDGADGAAATAPDDAEPDAPGETDSSAPGAA